MPLLDLAQNETDYDRVLGLNAIAEQLAQYTEGTGSFESYKTFAVAVKERNTPLIRTFTDTKKIIPTTKMLLAFPPEIIETFYPSPSVFKAIAANDVAEVRALAADKNFFRIRDFYNRTPLIVAAKNNKPEIVSALLQAGANTEVTDDQGNTAVMYAGLYGHRDVARFLVSTGANINKQNKDEKPAIAIAAELADNPERIQLLLDLKGSPIYKTALSRKGLSPSHQKESALFSAVRRNHKKNLRVLCRRWADTHFRNHQKRTLLMQAARYGDEEMVNFLLEGGAKHDDKDLAGLTAFLHAAEAGNVPILKLFIRLFADVIYQTDNNGHNALMLAAKNQNQEAVNLLLESGIDKYAKDKQGNSVLHLSAETGNTEILSLFITEGLPIEDKNAHQQNVLMLAAKHTNIPILQLLLDKKIFGIDTQDIKGQTALMFAAKSGNPKTLETVLSAKPCLEIMNHAKETALENRMNMLARYETPPPKGLALVIETLIRHGAKIPAVFSPLLKPIIDFAQQLLDKKKDVIEFFNKIFDTKKISGWFSPILLDFVGYGSHSQIISPKHFGVIFSDHECCKTLLAKRAPAKNVKITATHPEGDARKKRLLNKH